MVATILLAVTLSGTVLSAPSTHSHLPVRVLLAVPFTSQAPYGNWRDPRQQDGCEEAALTMAKYWVRDWRLSKAAALRSILAASAWEKKYMGGHPSLSARDTARLAREYFGLMNVAVQENVTTEDIKTALAQGKIVIVPTNGQVLGNPHYTRPGPPEHMLVIRGYDDATQRFITNDPGTRYGQGYTFPYLVLEAALREYPTGHREHIVALHKTAIIVAQQ